MVTCWLARLGISLAGWLMRRQCAGARHIDDKGIRERDRRPPHVRRTPESKGTDSEGRISEQDQMIMIRISLSSYLRASAFDQVEARRDRAQVRELGDVQSWVQHRACRPLRCA